MSKYIVQETTECMACKGQGTSPESYCRRCRGKGYLIVGDIDLEKAVIEIITRDGRLRPELKFSY